MKKFYLIILILISYSCGPSEEEIAKEKQKLIDSINLVNENKRLEEEKIREQLIQDSIAKANRRFEIKDVVGEWTVNLTCTYSNCSHTGTGDIRSESWFISYEENMIKVKVLGNTSTNNTYEGRFDGKNLTLKYEHRITETGFFTSSSKKVADVSASMKMIDEFNMTGTREVLNADPCQIRYDVEMRKK